MRRLAGAVVLAAALVASAVLTRHDAGAQGPSRGGVLTVLSTGDVDYIDPGSAYYQFTYMFTTAMHRTLYAHNPSSGRQPVPDLAAGPPEISPDGLTVTVRLRRGVRFSPPVNREVTARDVKYAIERAFRPNVPNGYARIYLGDVVGAAAARGGPIPGIETPDDHTLVFRLRRTTTRAVVGAMVLPVTAPVPAEYAAQFDTGSASRYGANQVTTGPYRLASYRPGRAIELERNPNWNPATDFRPARLDRIVVREGVSPAAGSREVLEGGSLVNGDFSPPPAILRAARRSRPDQVAVAPPTGNRYVALNTRVRPFTNVNVRRAVVAGFDRARAQRIRGGSAFAQVASHFIPPLMPGFDEAGGHRGPGYAFLANPRGSRRLAARYLRRAGFRRGRYTGRRRILMVGVNEGVGTALASHAARELRRLGFRVRLRRVSTDAMYGYCGVPARRVAVCPNVGWIEDFDDAQSMLDPTFHGRSITPQANANWSLLNHRGVNRAIDRAKLVVDPAERARAWGAVDRQITSLAAAVPLVWDTAPNIRSGNVDGVMHPVNGNWDLSFTGLR